MTIARSATFVFFLTPLVAIFGCGSGNAALFDGYRADATLSDATPVSDTGSFADAVDATQGDVPTVAPPDAAALFGDAPREIGTDNPAALQSTSGTRIQIARITTADGFSMVTGLFDRVLGVGCEIRRASDGSLRCLPAQTAINDTLCFADDQCTVPAGAYPRGCAIPPYVSDDEASETDLGSTLDAFCSAPENIFQAGGATGSTWVTPVPLDECDGEFPPWDGPGLLLAGALAPTDLVAFTLERRYADARFDALTLGGDDGSSVDLSNTYVYESFTTDYDGHPWVTPSIYDTVEGARTLPLIGVDGVTRWLPDGAGYLLGSVDPACIQPLYEASVDDCYGVGEPFMLASTSGGATVDVQRLSDPYSGPYWSNRMDTSYGTCAAGESVCTTCFTTATEEPPSSFAEAAPVLIGAGRIELQGLAVGTAALPLHQAYDTQIAAACTFMTTSDGALRCVPGDDLSGDVFYTDAACTDAVYLIGDEGYSGTSAFVFVTSGGVCTRQSVVYARADQPPLETIAQAYSPGFTGTCAPFDAGPRTILRLTRPTSPNDFAEGLRVVE